MPVSLNQTEEALRILFEVVLSDNPSTKIRARGLVKSFMNTLEKEFESEVKRLILESKIINEITSDINKLIKEK